LSLTTGKVFEVGGTTGVIFEVPDALNLDVPVKGFSVEVVLEVVLRYLEAPVKGSAYSSLALVSLELILRYLEAPSFQVRIQNRRLVDGSPVNGSAYSLLPLPIFKPEVFFSINCAT